MKSRRAYGLDSEMGERGVNAVAINTLFFFLGRNLYSAEKSELFSLCFPLFFVIFISGSIYQLYFSSVCCLDSLWHL